LEFDYLSDVVNDVDGVFDFVFGVHSSGIIA
jgi:hypothetical protein